MRLRISSRRRVSDLVNGDRLGDIEAAGFRAAKRFQMRAATEHFANVVNIGANIKAFAAQDAEIDFGRCDSVDSVAIDVNEAWLALHNFSLARQLIQRHAAVFFCRNHGRQLIEIAAKFFERDANLIFIQRRHRTLLDHFAFTVLCAGRHAEHERAHVFFVLAHEQILNLCATSHSEQKQARGDRIERAAMANLFRSKLSPRQRDDVVRRHPFGFIHEQDAVRRCRRA